ncbi:beta-glucosidase [Burkholderia pseudomallei]|uniref:beta-glucosidase n=1 Tax=Burkholderia pseudomallei TaxID=28450 RepID=UPI000A447F3B
MPPPPLRLADSRAREKRVERQRLVMQPPAQRPARDREAFAGDANPSGKLPITFARKAADLPQPAIDPASLRTVYGEGLMIGYRWYDATNVRPLFPFGVGLPYTTFVYSGMSAQAGAAGNVTVGFTVTNTGARGRGSRAGLCGAARRARRAAAAARRPGEGRAAAGPGAARRRHDCGETLRDLGRGRARVAVECGSYRLSVAASSRDPNALSQPGSFNGARL